ncbi:MAG: hypothetical protein V2J25_01020 [Desulfatiglans sp.]|jgi:hypothetical protein|nr:hypothetical protein [Thermodesulfobacteriota bacterium]MEE4351426.1 hypothetical protein [Desulfatiglans sp.]
MEILRFKDLKPGMIVAEPVYNFNRMPLLQEGTMLTQKDLWILKTWGVTEVAVLGACGSPECNKRPPQAEDRSSIANRLSVQFSDVSDDPNMRAIMQAAGKRLEKRLRGKKQES